MANIQDKLNKIITAIFGKDVRQALYDGLDTINKETENTTAKQQHLEDTFDQLVINAGNSNSEIVDARVDKNNGNKFEKIGDRLDAHSAQLEQKAPIDYVRKSTLIKPINHSEFDTETKKLFTGGSVAVVGEKAVGRENLKDKVVGVTNIDHSVLKNTLANLISTDLYVSTGKNGGTIDSILNEVVTFTSTTDYGTFNRIFKTDNIRKYIAISKCKVVNGSDVTAKHSCYSYSISGENLGKTESTTSNLSSDYITITSLLKTKELANTCHIGITLNKPCTVEIKEQIILDVTGLSDEIINNIDFLKFGYFEYGVENTILYSEFSDKSIISDFSSVSDFANDGNFAKTTDKFKNILGSFNDIQKRKAFWNNGSTIEINESLKEVKCTPTVSYGSLLIWTPTAENTVVYGKKYKIVTKVKADKNTNISLICFIYDKSGVKLGSIESNSFAVGNNYSLYSFDLTINKENCSYVAIGTVNRNTSVYVPFTVKESMLIDITDKNISGEELKNIDNGYWDLNPKIAKLAETSLVAEKALTLDDSFMLKEDIIFTRWKGKKVLVIGDSITAAGLWQLQLKKMLGMEVKTHAKGGVGIVAMVDGDKGLDGDYDNETNASGTLYPLSTTDVQDVDLIVVLPGYNERDTDYGVIGDLYPTEKTIVGKMQYLFNRIYEELEKANNLSCKVIVATPHCFGKYPYSNANGYEEHNGKKVINMVDSIISITNSNNIPVCDLWRNSGINKFTWSAYSASSVVDNDKYTKFELNSNGEVIGETLLKYVKGQSYYQIRDGICVLEEYTGSAPYPYNGDQLHLNTSGYSQIGECIVGSIIKSYGY